MTSACQNQLKNGLCYGIYFSLSTPHTLFLTVFWFLHCIIQEELNSIELRSLLGACTWSYFDMYYQSSKQFFRIIPHNPILRALFDEWAPNYSFCFEDYSLCKCGIFLVGWHFLSQIKQLREAFLFQPKRLRNIQP